MSTAFSSSDWELLCLQIHQKLQLNKHHTGVLALEEDTVLCEYVYMGMGSTGEADIKYRFFLLSGKRAIVDINNEALAGQGRSIYFCLGIQGRLPGEVTPPINLEA